MGKISFVLKRPKSKKPTAIILLYTCSDGRLPYYTGESILPKQWPGKIDKGTATQLDRFVKRIDQLIVDYRIKGEPLTKAVLTASLNQLIHRSLKRDSRSMYSAMRKIIDQMEAGKILTPKKKKRYAPGTIRVFRYNLDIVEKFDPNLTVSTVSIVTYNKFIKYCHDQNWSTNYIGTLTKNWRTLGKLLGGNPVYNDPDFKRIFEDSSDIYLDENELAAIFEANLEARQDLVRDWYILDSYTGLRVSDLVMLVDKNLSKELITIANNKTDEKVIIPVHPYVKKILKKYNGFPPPITDVEINRIIKPVAKDAGIDGIVLYSITKGGRRKNEYLKKWEMVSCHTARRSFITNLRKAGIPDSIVMKLTGIKSPTTLKKYDKLTADEAAKIAAGLEFFK